MFWPEMKTDRLRPTGSTRTAARLFATVATLATLSVFAGAVTAGPSPASAPTPDEARRLAAGEVLVRLDETAAGPREGVARGVIDAPPERVAAVLADFAHYREWMPFVERSDARREADGTVVSAQSLHLPALVGDRSYRIRAVSAVAEGKDGRLWSTRWTYVPGSGNVVDTHGSWTVTGFGPGAGGTGARRSLAVCHLFTDPGGRVPHWAVDRATGESLPWIFHGLRQQVLRERYLKD